MRGTRGLLLNQPHSPGAHPAFRLIVTPDQKFWWNWAINAVLAFATFLVFVAALFGDILRGLIRPQFNLQLVRSEGERTVIRNVDTGALYDDVRYYHARVSNRRRWLTAEEVQVYLTRVEEPGPDDVLQPTWTGNIPMRWRDQEYVPLTRNIGADADIDLFRIERHHGLFLMPLLTPHNLNFHRQGSRLTCPTAKQTR